MEKGSDKPKCTQCGSGFIYFTDKKVKCRACGNIEDREVKK